MQIQKKHIIGWSFLGIILFISYYLLGGFTEVKIELKEQEKFYITGKKFIGESKDATLDSLVEATHQAYTEGKLSGTFSICFFGNPDEADTVEVLVGTMHIEEIAPPKNYIQESFKAGSAIVASIEAEAVVAPSATETNEKIEGFAKENDLRLKDIFIEKYEDDFKIVTVVPVEQNR